MPLEQAVDTIRSPLGDRKVARLSAVLEADRLARLPYSIRVLLESVVRTHDGRVVRDRDLEALVGYDPRDPERVEVPFMPARVLLQDFTGVPAVVDLAAVREAVVRLAGSEEAAERVNPRVPCDLVIDHSVQVDVFNRPDALLLNSRREFERNRERYELLKWAQRAFHDFRVVPPATGIVHQVNLEYLARVVWEEDGWLFPDSLVGTDSHTTMINGLGVLGWGVGGIEAEAVMLGQPVSMLLPEVVGFRLTGRLGEEATATDLVLRVTQMLREHGVVGKFVEFLGPGLAEMPVADRATIANMAPEYGATVGFFPVDGQTLRYLRLTGRQEALVETVEQYARLQGLWRDDGRQPEYGAMLELDLGTVEPSVAGPRRPQDRVALSGVKGQWEHDLVNLYGRPSPAGAGTVPAWEGEGGAPAPAGSTVGTLPDGVEVTWEGETFTLGDGSVVIAAITSCTNTSNPQVMLAAGLLARKARERGLGRRPWVKTSLAPGSKVVTEYLRAAGLLEDLEALGFYLVGYGCTTCIGNSGPLPDPLAEGIREHDLVAVAVLSGNRNFEGRISPDTRANYLASPPLVVAYALAGRIDVDLTSEPLGRDAEGREVYLGDLWPSQAEIAEAMAASVSREQFVRQYSDVFQGPDEWRSIEAEGGLRYAWDPDSTYVQEPPFFEGMTVEPGPIRPVEGARVLLWVGDSVTTDHISPAGSISSDSPAGRYLIERGVEPRDFNSYGSRRGNDRVMTRGTFANVRVRNRLAPGTEGGFTTDLLTGDVTTVHQAAMHYRREGIPLVVLAGKDYGMGSSRDWAAKGTLLLGVRAVLAESFERIHRSNLIGMGVLPLTFPAGESAESLGIQGTERFDITVPEDLGAGQEVEVRAVREDGTEIVFPAMVRIDTPVEVEYYRHGGILPYVVRQMVREASPAA